MVHFDRIKGAKLSNSFDVRNLNREKGSEERLGILAISLFLLLTRDCHAQLRETFTTYESSYFHTTHDIDIVARDLDHYELHIRLMSYDMLNLEGGIQVSSEQYQQFISSLKTAKQNFEDWLQRIKTTDKSNIDTILDLHPLVYGFFRYGGRWRYDKEHALSFTLKRMLKRQDEQPVFVLSIGTGMLKYLYNNQITHQGFRLVFSSPNEVQVFMDKLSVQNIREFIKLKKPRE